MKKRTAVLASRIIKSNTSATENADHWTFLSQAMQGLQAIDKGMAGLHQATTIELVRSIDNDSAEMVGVLSVWNGRLLYCAFFFACQQSPVWYFPFGAFRLVLSVWYLARGTCRGLHPVT